jgi:WD40-like Beta Propeller Repeat
VQPSAAVAARSALSRKVIAVVAAGVTASGALAVGSAWADVHGTRATALISRNANGPSAGGAFSQDGRRVTYYAFTSAASNLVGGDSNGALDVFVLRRSGLGGRLRRVSVTSGGAQANGNSSNPSVDGDVHHRPHCVAFQSSAGNLDPRDTSPDSDIFVRDLANGTTRLMSAGATDAVHPTIDGACRLVTYEAGGTVYVASVRSAASYAIAQGSAPAQETDGRGVTYVRDGQVWYQRYARTAHGVARRGPEQLVSAGRLGPGNGPSGHPSVSANGDYIAFESSATNLCAGLCRGVSADRNGSVSDVFRRTMSRHAPTHDRMEMASYSAGADAQGNGPSNDPVISSAGQFVIFDSAATNLRPTSAIHHGDPNGRRRDVFVWNFPPARGRGNVSRESRPGRKGAFRAPSMAPATSAHGNYVAFTCSARGRAVHGSSRAIPNVFMRFLGGA